MAGIGDIIASLAVKITGDIGDFERALNTANTRVKTFASDVNTNLKKSFAEQDRFIRDFDKGVGRLGSQIQNTGRIMTASLTLPIAAAGLASLKSFAQTERLRKGLQQITGDAKKAGEEFERLEKSARIPGLSLDQAVRGSIRLQTVGLSAEKARGFIEEFANANALIGQGAPELDRALYGLQQLANTDFPLGEDLNILKDAIPQIVPLLDKAFGTARAEELRKLGISSKQILDVILSGLKDGPRAVGGLGEAWDKLGTRVDKALFKIGESLDKNFDITGKLERFGDLVEDLSKDFGKLTPETQAAILSLTGFAAAVGPVLFGIGSLTKAIPTLVLGFNSLKAAASGSYGIISKIGVPLTIIAGAIALSAVEDAGTEAEQKKLSETAAKSFNASIGNFEKLSTDRLLKLKQTLGKQFRDAVFDSQRLGSGTDTEASKVIAEQINGQLIAIEKVLQDRNNKLKEASDQAVKDIAAGNQAIADAIKSIQKQLKDAELKGIAFGDEYDVIANKAGILQKGIENLIELGLKPQSKAVQTLIDQYRTLGAVELKTLQNQLSGIKPLTPKGILPDGNLDSSYFKLPVPEVTGTESAIQKLDEFAAGAEERLKKITASFVDQGADLKATANDIFLTLASSAASGLGEMAAAIATGDQSAKSAISNFIGGLAKQLAQGLIALGTPLLLSPLTAPQGIALLAAGAVLTGLGSGIASSGRRAASAPPVISTIKTGFSSQVSATQTTAKAVEVASAISPTGSQATYLNINGQLELIDRNGALIGYINSAKTKATKTGG